MEAGLFDGKISADALAFKEIMRAKGGFQLFLPAFTLFIRAGKTLQAFIRTYFASDNKSWTTREVYVQYNSC